MFRSVAIGCTVLFSLMTLVPGAAAGEFSLSVDRSDGFDLGANEVLGLDLNRACEIALARNLDLQVGRYDLAIAETQIIGASGVFDPTFNLGVNGDSTESPSASQLDGAEVNESRNTSFALGLSNFLPTGGSLGVDLRTRRTETNSQFYFLNPNWGTQFGATFTQPLLKNFGTLVNRSGIIIARTNREQAVETLKLQVISTLQQVENAYWDYASAQVEVEVKQQSLELATQLMEETGERIRVGTSAPIDLVQSEATVATRRQELILARNARANAEDALKKVLGFETPQEWALNIDTTEPYVFIPLEVNLAESIETALEQRPEVRQQNLALENMELNTKIARNATLPSLDLSASYGYSGVGGTLNTEDPVTEEPMRIKGGFDDSLDQIINTDFPYWTLGVTLKMPLGNNEAKATLARRRFEHHQAVTRMTALKQSITHDVRLAVRYLYDGAASVDAAKASRVLAERNAEAEQTKFQNGLSTNFLVLQIQDDLANAQLSALRARLNYRRAIVGYRVATGTLLDEIGIDIADPGAQEEPHTLWRNVKWMQFSDLSKDGDDAAN
ncbi:MAG: TolC family protein [Thermoanaerobaculales bacterium]|nr:TolC family protein [Thermoanaerobaculales bacterium]